MLQLCAGWARVGDFNHDHRLSQWRADNVSVQICSGEFTSPNGGVKPPLRQTEPLPARWKSCKFVELIVRGGKRRVKGERGRKR